MLDDNPFNTQNECEFPTSLESVIQYSQSIKMYGNSPNIDMKKFRKMVKEQIKKLTLRSQELLKIRKKLDERGTKIEEAL